MTADEQILNRGQDCIPYDDFWNLKEITCLNLSVTQMKEVR